MGNQLVKIDGLQSSYSVNRTNIAKQYEADHDVIARLRDEIAEDVNRTQYVERYAYENLLKVLDAAEKRCGGDRSVLIE